MANPHEDAITAYGQIHGDPESLNPDSFSKSHQGLARAELSASAFEDQLSEYRKECLIPPGQSSSTLGAKLSISTFGEGLLVGTATALVTSKMGAISRFGIVPVATLLGMGLGFRNHQDNVNAERLQCIIAKARVGAEGQK